MTKTDHFLEFLFKEVSELLDKVNDVVTSQDDFDEGHELKEDFEDLQAKIGEMIDARS
jgi:hypothetical protein